MSKTVLITGCSRGLGLELAYQYARDGHRVHACAREPGRSEALLALVANYPEQISLHGLDVTSDSQIKALDRALGDERIDLLIHNAGCYGPRGVSLGEWERESWRQVFEVNTLSPLLLTQTLLWRVASSPGGSIAFISSIMGSLAENAGGGSLYYRSSKAALNQAAKTLAEDLRERGICVVALHPGWVKTDMGGESALLTPEESVSGLRQLLDRLSLRQSGRFFHVEGQEIPW
ncbi:SDR family oxidoreductase [Nitrincola tapanii]|uniref:SDR family oxidoreductase n=1 Tax=Nitrincola tapanii TaxID=1708751 RepID=A0A5A9W061_9GAMM|nr:SDR family oxidoreductase [Nitrincola tapanii]KAA0874140.1 SDR family oxidoreductase [Nitrincola tapanii]